MTPDERTRRALADIVAFAEEVRRYVIAAGEDRFYGDRPVQLAAEALLHRIGEAVSRLDEPFRAEHPDVEWNKMRAMRNVIAHEYGFIDYRIVWRALNESLPRDVELIERILATSEDG